MPRKQEISERSENGEVIWCFTGVSLAGGFAAERKRHAGPGGGGTRRQVGAACTYTYMLYTYR